MKRPRIVVYEDKSKTSQRWRYKVISANEEVVATGEGFLTEAHAWRSVSRLPAIIATVLLSRVAQRIRG